MKIIIELHNGQRFTYINWPPGDMIDDLKKMGLTIGMIKNTIHVIPRDVVPLGTVTTIA